MGLSPFTQQQITNARASMQAQRGQPYSTMGQGGYVTLNGAEADAAREADLASYIQAISGFDERNAGNRRKGQVARAAVLTAMAVTGGIGAAGAAAPGAGAGTAAGAGTSAGGVASVPGAVGGSAITAASQGVALGVPTVGAAAPVLPSTSLIPAAVKTLPKAGADSMGYGKTELAAEGVKAAANLFGAKKGADSNTKSADMQTKAATEAARIQAQSSADQLAYFERQSELDRLSKRFTDKQNYGLSKAGMENDFTRYGDTSFNTRASELSQGRTQDKMYGARQNQMNYMRNLLGMPQNELSVYVEPDALQLTRPTLPDYVEDTTPTRTPIRTT